MIHRKEMLRRSLGSLLSAWIVLCLTVPLQVGATETETPDEDIPAVQAEETQARTESEDKVEVSDTSEPAPKWYKGSVRAGFDGFWASGGDRDIELDQFLQFQIHPPKNERLQLHGALWLIEKLDSPSSRNSALRDLNDTFNERVLARVSHLYVNAEQVWGNSVLRVGRQRIMEGAAYNRIDGLYFKKQVNNWDWYVFGGTRATFYDQDFEDPVFGGGIAYIPSGRTKLALDVYHGRESRPGSRYRSLHGPVAMLYRLFTDSPQAKRVDSTAVTLSAWHTVNEYLSLYGRLNLYDDRGEEILLNLSGYLPKPFDVIYEIAYRRQFNSIGERASDITGYYRLMGVYDAYDNFFISLYRPLTEKILVSLETEIHNSRGDTWSNRDYERYAAYIQGQNLGNTLNLDAKAGLERWSVNQGGSSWAVVGEVGRRWESCRVALGADYQRYQDQVTEYDETLMLLDMARVWFAPGILQGYNPFLLLFGKYKVEMRENIYTFYLKGQWDISQDQDITARVSFEESDRPNSPIWRIQANYTYRF